MNEKRSVLVLFNSRTVAAPGTVGPPSTGPELLACKWSLKRGPARGVLKDDRRLVSPRLDWLADTQLAFFVGDSGNIQRVRSRGRIRPVVGVACQGTFRHER